MYLPSGLQRGVCSLCSELVSCSWRLPSQLAIQMSLLSSSFTVSGVETV